MELVAEGGEDGPSVFEQGFRVGFGGFLKTQQRLPAVVTVSMAAGKEFGLGDPNAVFVPPKVDLGNGNNHQEMS